jgi:hypothetical protein
MVIRTTKRMAPLGICNHCGSVARVWDYGEPVPGKEHAICYGCIQAIIQALG